MANCIRIKSALISVYHKDGLAPLVKLLHSLEILIYSTGGTFTFIRQLGIPATPIEEITAFPEILGGRVKTLHPKIFGGILNRKDEKEDQSTLVKHQIPNIDLVIVDLYPFEETVKSTQDETDIIEKIDIGGVSLLRAAAKNFTDVAVISSIEQYPALIQQLSTSCGSTERENRKQWAGEAFARTQAYDRAIQHYFQKESPHSTTLRYGENPHQKATFDGDLNLLFDQLSGKELSYNNLLDIDAAWRLMKDFSDEVPFFAIIKHNNPCGLALAKTLEQAYAWALESDPVSAFGGVLIANRPINMPSAQSLNSLFFEILMAPDFHPEAYALLQEKPNRIMLKIKPVEWPQQQIRSILNGTLIQDSDSVIVEKDSLILKSQRPTSSQEQADLIVANTVVKHTKSNAIALVKNGRLLACGTGQTSRVDALEQAVEKSKKFGFDLSGAVMASDAFFPFPDCVEIAAKEGIKAIIQPGGSIKDHLSIEACDRLKISMVFTGYRHFKH